MTDERHPQPNPDNPEPDSWRPGIGDSPIDLPGDETLPTETAPHVRESPGTHDA